MKVGLYFDLRNPSEWRQGWHRLYDFTLEVCEEADRLGAGSIWLTEHHLFEDGYLPQPITFAAALAARTSRVRIGTALVIAPLYHTVHLAEQAAVVDILSGGRLDLGLGAGYRRAEFELFGVDVGRRRAATFETVRALRSIWAEGKVTPAPLQNRLPIWIGSTTASSAHTAGLLNEGLLRVAPELLDPYRAGLVEGGHDPSSARMAGPVHCLLSDDPERDWPEVSRHVGYQATSYARYRAEGTGVGVPDVDPEVLRARGIRSGALNGFLFATPEDAADEILQLAGNAPVETVFIWGSVAGLAESLVAKNVELACTRLVPLLAQRGTSPLRGSSPAM